ncbi:division/cell wall cluster transcriptional repressor MraZ [Futiania mangrovi]|uniref:Transcriptional regulator MraZ n=1 Tax=Futiania mangrovi TaxID=2959716 RepID=A0A9J6PB80_9PROT|nr:hypothetical protein [Futiania mangrovii]MCP1334944.1 hypothetical protein [Futiania mangrovii]
MSEPLFLGTYRVRCDGKGRVSVPAQLRAELRGTMGMGFFAYPSLAGEPALECCEPAHLRRLTSVLDRMSPLSKTRRKLERRLQAQATQLQIDGDGRTVLNADLRARLGLGEKGGELVFAGRGRVFEIWSADVFDAQLDDALGEDEEEMFAAAWSQAVEAGTAQAGEGAE